MEILIADDDLTSRTMLQGLTRKWGYRPIVVTDGDAAWEQIRQPIPPRLMILDWKMPGLDGLELCARIRQQKNSDPPYIILLTAQHETEDIVRGLASGANDYVGKPFETAELQARLQVGRRMLALQQELNDARDKLAHQALHDPLLGIHNRRAIIDSLEIALERTRREQTPLTLAICDLDHFKQVNDGHGHIAGDLVLKEFCRRVKAAIRSYDLFGRYGGEEFLLVMQSDCAQSHQLFERIRKAIAETAFDLQQIAKREQSEALPEGSEMPSSEQVPQDDNISSFEETRLSITVSFGISCYAVGKTATQLLSEADDALYQSKSAGRNRISIFS